MSIKERIEHLRDVLNHHNYLYYIEDNPQISILNLSINARIN